MAGSSAGLARLHKTIVRLIAVSTLALVVCGMLGGVWISNNRRSLTVVVPPAVAAEPSEASAPNSAVPSAPAPGGAEATAPAEASTHAQTYLPVTAGRQARMAGGWALDLDGVAAHVEVADAAPLRLTKQFTLEAWIRPASVTSHRHIVGKNYYELSVDPYPGGWTASIEVRSGGKWYTASTGPLAFGNWHHVAGTYDGTELRVYVDGELGGRTRVSGPVDTSSRPLHIGSADGAGDIFHGAIDEARISSTVRYTAAFAAPTGPFTADAATAGLWHLDEGAGEQTADASAGAHAGKLVSGPQWSADQPWEGGPMQTPAATPVPPTATGIPPTIPPATPTPVEPSRGISGVTRQWTGSLGYSDVGSHQVVRTSGDRVYIFAPEIYTSYVRGLRAGSTGTPSGFAEADQAGRPQADSTIWAVDAAIDGKDMVHLVYLTEAGEVVYTSFDTTTDRWGKPETIAGSKWPNRNNDMRQGSAGVTIALDAMGVAHAVYGKTENATRRVYYNSNAGGTWSNEQPVDELPGNDNSHATLAFAPDGTLYVAWLSAPDANRGSLMIRALKDNAWAAQSLVDDKAFANQGYSIDQGPSLIVGPDGTVHVVYIAPYEQALNQPSRYEYGRTLHRQSVDGGRTWSSDDPPLRYTHNPSLWIDPEGNLVIFGHREYWLGERCASMLVTVRPAGGAWSNWRVFADGCYDASVSTRWAQFHRFAPDVLDLLYWTEKGPNSESDINQLHYAEVRGGINTLLELPPVPEQ